MSVGLLLPAGMRVQWRGGVLEVAVEGRTTLDAVEAFTQVLRDAAGAGVRFKVLYDRSAVTAPTKEGRRALNTWPTELLPVVGRHCVAWADVLSARRMASVQRAGYVGGVQRSPYGYLQCSFIDLSEARAWLAASGDDVVAVS